MVGHVMWWQQLQQPEQEDLAATVAPAAVMSFIGASEPLGPLAFQQQRQGLDSLRQLAQPKQPHPRQHCRQPAFYQLTGGSNARGAR